MDKQDFQDGTNSFKDNNKRSGGLWLLLRPAASATTRKDNQKHG